MKKILIVADLRGWILDRHAQEIQRRLSEFQIDIGYSRGTNVVKLAPNYDIVYIMDPMAMSYPPPYNVVMGLRNEFMYLNHKNGAKGLYEDGLPNYGTSIKNKCSMFHVVNRRQFDAFKDVVLDKPLMLVQHGIDENIFDKNKYEKVNNDVLVVGTSGRDNSPGGKGFDIVTEACKRVGAKHFATRYQGMERLTKEQMPHFYRHLDVFVSMSLSEGLNNPIMEAGAMEVSVVSTYAGAAPEMIVDGENGFLIERNVEALVGALNKMKDANVRMEMGNKFYKEIMTNWTWKIRINDFRKMFESFFNMKRG